MGGGKGRQRRASMDCRFPTTIIMCIARGEKKKREREKEKKKNNNKRREKRGIAAREGKEVRGGRREGRNDAKKMGTRDITFVVSRCAVLPARYTYLRTYLELLP